jgi:hypothetical protein
MDYKDTVDDWAEDTDDFCHACDDWTEPDEHGCCKDCGVEYNTIDPFISPSVAKVYSSPAPYVSAQGDVWGRGGSYTWGSVGSATASAWGGWSTGTSSSARMLKHKRHLDSLCKVVDPNVKHTLNFATKGKNYSNMRTGALYVDGTLIKDSDTNLDIVAGLSIHEKLHLVHTQPLVKWQKKYAYDKRLSNAQTDLLHSIGNIIEDEYIESQLAKTHAGYVTYIDKVKEHFFAKHDIGTIKGNVIADVLNTLLAMVRFPSTISDERKKRHAKHIQFFARALKDALVDRESTLVAIQSIYEYMYQLAKEEASKRKDTSEEEILERAETRMSELLKEWGDSADGYSEEDLSKIKDRLIQQEREDASRADRYSGETALREAIDKSGAKLADYAGESESISDRLDKAIRDLADSEYAEEEWDSGRALGLRQGTKVTWRNQHANDHESSLYDETVKKMKSSIGQLKRKIQLYGDTKIHTIRNQRRGKLDKKMLHKIPLGRPDLFKNVIVDEDKPLDVCLLVDESGSMGSWKMDKARQTAIALREALKDNQALNLWVFGHTADGYDWHREGETNMSVYWSPTYQSDVRAIGSMKARAENRDGMALLASAERVKAESPSMGSNKLMIVISDGEPSANGYRYTMGVPHTKKCVKHLEGHGWSIIQVGISGARESSMREMFSNYLLVDDTNELPAKISKIIRKVIKV